MSDRGIGTLLRNFVYYFFIIIVILLLIMLLFFLAHSLFNMNMLRLLPHIFCISHQAGAVLFFSA